MTGVVIMNPLVLLLLGFAFIALGLVLFWPGRGSYWKWRRYQRLGERGIIEDALKHMHQLEFEGRRANVDTISGALQVTRNRAAKLVESLEHLGLSETDADGCRLSADGQGEALRIVRVHRLLEQYLAEQTGWDETDWHEQADQQEHFLSADEVDQLAEQMGYPRYDPHGDPIPTAEGEIPQAQGVPLNSLSSANHVVVVHVEDEPDAIYAQLVALGISVGSRLRIIEATPQRIRIAVDGVEHILAPVVAANLTVVELPKDQAPQVAARRLSDLAIGESAEVVDIAPACRGVQRRRLLDLGVVPGTVIQAELESLSGDPTAYSIRGATIALRRRQADWILVTPS